MQTNRLWEKTDQWLPGSGREQWGGIVKTKLKETFVWVRGVMDKFIILITVLISWVYTHVKTYQVIHFKYVQFIVCRLYLNKDVK